MKGVHLAPRDDLPSSSPEANPALLITRRLDGDHATTAQRVSMQNSGIMPTPQAAKACHPSLKRFSSHLDLRDDSLSIIADHSHSNPPVARHFLRAPLAVEAVCP